MKRLLLFFLLIPAASYSWFDYWGQGGRWGDENWSSGKWGNSGTSLIFNAPLLYNTDISPGSGSATFTRSTAATVRDNIGNVVTCAVNEARFQGARRISEGVWSNTDAGGAVLTGMDGVLIEAQKKNETTYSETLDNATGGWTETNVTPTLNFTTAPDTASTATKIIPSAGSSEKSISKAIAGLSDNEVYMASVFVKKNDFQFVYINITGKDAGSTSTWYNLDTGAVATDNNTHSRIESFGSSWYRISAGKDIASGGTTPVFKFAIADDDNTSTATGDGSIYNLFWGAQVENADFASSYIKTVAATVTRTKDVLWFPAGTNADSTIGSLVFDFKLVGLDTGIFPSFVNISDNSSNNYLGFPPRFTTFKGRFILRVSGVSAMDGDSDANDLVPNTDQKHGVAWQEDDVKVWLDGTSFLTDTIVSMPAAYTRIYIGADQIGNAVIHSTIKNVKIYKTRLTDDEMGTLTQ